MPTEASYKISTKRQNRHLKVAKGHFATNHSHINYYIDVTTQKTRLSEAQAVASELVSYYSNSTIVDSILCLDGTQVIGTCLAEELTRGGFVSINAHKTIYVLTPEHTTPCVLRWPSLRLCSSAYPSYWLRVHLDELVIM